MHTFHIHPIEPLRPYIDRLWGWESAADEVVALPTLLPGTGAEVFFHYRSPFRRVMAGETTNPLENAHLTCVRREPVWLCPSSDIGFVAIRFRAGSLHRFTKVPGADLVDQCISVADLWGKTGKELADRDFAAMSSTEMLQLLQAFLVKQLEDGHSDELVEVAISRIYRKCADTSISKLASDLGVGRRQLERRFKALTGQTPVEVRRLSRFQKVVRELMLDRTASLLEAALSQGYYDQSHLTHAFDGLGVGSPQQHINEARSKTHFYNTPWGADI